MPVEGPLASSARGDQPDKVLSGARQGPSLQWEGRKEGLSHLRGGKLTSEGISPSQKKEVYERRLRTYPEGQDLLARGEQIPQGDLLSLLPPGIRMEDVRRKSTTMDLEKASLPCHAW
jgi:hypothetical protein